MDIRQLLKKKGWTGEEAGKAVILDLIHGYKDKDKKPLFSRDKLMEMIAKFDGRREDVEAYNKYCNLQTWLMQYQAVANAYLQRFNSCCSELVSVHNAAEAAENEYRYIEQLPRIMTQKQYDEFKAKRIEEILDPDGDGSNMIGEDLFSLIIRATVYYVVELEKNPKADNPLKAVRKAYKKQTVTAPELVTAYNRMTGNGYYQLQDGTRSDELTKEEWRDKLLACNPDLQRLQDEAAEGQTGKPGSLSYERELEEAKAAHTGQPRQKEKDRAVWHTYEELPDGVTKWDVLAELSHVSDYARHEVGFRSVYTCLLNGEGYAEQTAAFRSVFPELTDAILKALDANGYTEDGKPLSAVPIEDWRSVVITYRELYDTDFPGFRADIESNISIFEDDKRATMNGIAIITPSDLFNGNFSPIDERGYYIEPDRNKFFTNMFGLNAYLPDNEESGDNIAKITRTRAWLAESLRYILAYDTALELIAKEIGIPDFTVFSVNAKHSYERAEAVSELFDVLYTHIEEIDYQDQEAKEAKLQALRDVFPPIDMEAIKISEEKKREAARMLEGLGAFAEGRSGTTPGWNFLSVMVTPEGGAAE